MIDLDELLELLPAYLAAQRFYASDRPPVHVEIVDVEVWIEGDPGLVWLLVDATDAQGGVARYQLVLGARWGTTDHEFLHGKEHEVLGALDGPDGSVVAVYDAVADPELVAAMLERLTGDQVHNVRPLHVEQSNTSIVYDEHLIAKLFRRIHDGPNPDVATVEGLQEAGCSTIPRQHLVYRKDGRDLLVVRDYLLGAVDGWKLALTSLRDLIGSEHMDPAEAGGDFAPEARRLGAATAELHRRLIDAFGADHPDIDEWIDGFRTQLRRVAGSVDAAAIGERYRAVAGLDDLGVAMRIHGDLHLGQTLRADAGWFFIDFEGEPARPLAERLRPSSPLRDLAGMLRSFHYAQAVALAERIDVGDVEHAQADAWEMRTRSNYLAGYLASDGVRDLLPPEPNRQLLLDVFELDKAVYEVAYELGHRPEWAVIPKTAIARILR